MLEYRNLKLIPVKNIEVKDGKKRPVFGFRWSEYIYRDVPQEYFDEAKYTALLSGKASNLTIIDIDNVQAKETLENALNMPIEQLSNHIVKTRRGWQLFFQYNSSLASKVGVAESVDVLSDDKLSFALVENEGYEIYHDAGLPGRIPLALLRFLKKEDSASNTSLFSKEKGIHDCLHDPLINYVQKYLQKPGKPTLAVKRAFKNRLFGGTPFEEVSKPGTRHDVFLRALGVLAADVTIDEHTYYQAANALVDLIRPDDKNLDGMIDYAYEKSFQYDPSWAQNKQAAEEQSIKETSSLMEQLEQLGYDLWYDPSRDKYNLRNFYTGGIDVLPKSALKDHIRRVLFHKRGLMVDPKFKFWEIISYDRVEFNPQKSSRAREEIEGGRLITIYNTFLPSARMREFEELKKEVKEGEEVELPPFISKVVGNVFSVKEHRDLFLHNLAFWLHTKEPCQTAIISLGKTQGVGKSLLYESVLGKIVGYDYCLTRDASSVNSSFNGELENKLVVHYSEVTETKSRYTSPLVYKLKNVIGEKNLIITGKGKETKNIRNYLFITMSSNDMHPFDIDFADNRRFNFFPTCDKKLKEVAGEILADEDVDDVIERELSQFLRYLASIKLSRKTYHKLVQTELYDAIRRDSAPLSEQVACAILNKDLDALDDIAPMELFDEVKRRVVEQNLAYIASADLKMVCSVGGIAYNYLIKAFKSQGVEIASRRLPMEKRQARVVVWNPGGVWKLE